jgi:hypothetical protein
MQQISEDEIKKKEKLFSMGFYISVSVVALLIVFIILSLAL